MNFVMARDDWVLKRRLEPAPILRTKKRNKNQQFYLCFDGSPPRSSSFHFHKMNTEFLIISQIVCHLLPTCIGQGVPCRAQARLNLVIQSITLILCLLKNSNHHAWQIRNYCKFIIPIHRRKIKYTKLGVGNYMYYNITLKLLPKNTKTVLDSTSFHYDNQQIHPKIPAHLRHS